MEPECRKDKLLWRRHCLARERKPTLSTAEKSPRLRVRKLKGREEGPSASCWLRMHFCLDGMRSPSTSLKQQQQPTTSCSFLEELLLLGKECFKSICIVKIRKKQESHRLPSFCPQFFFNGLIFGRVQTTFLYEKR